MFHFLFWNLHAFISFSCFIGLQRSAGEQHQKETAGLFNHGAGAPPETTSCGPLCVPCAETQTALQLHSAAVVNCISEVRHASLMAKLDWLMFCSESPCLCP